MLWPSPPWEGVTYWALDLETGGLDAKSDPILAVGMVPVRGGAIRLGETYASLVRPEAPRAHPAGLHARSPPRAARRARGADARLRCSPRSTSRIREGALLVHNAAVGRALSPAGVPPGGAALASPPVVDTVALLLKAARRARFVDPDAPASSPS